MRKSEIAPGQVLTVSQSRYPSAVKQALLVSSIREGWIGILVNLNGAILFGVILLVAGLDALSTLVFLGTQIIIASLAALTWLYLLTQDEEVVAKRSKLMHSIILVIDAAIMLGWGISMLLFYDSAEYQRTAILIVLLMAAGIASATLSSKLTAIMISGRITLFLPSLVYLLWFQPPLWGMHSGILIFAFAFSIGVGYAVHVQNLRVANLNIDLKSLSEELENSLDNERIWNEKSLMEAALREHFLRSVTHDLRQPINALRLFIDELGLRLSDHKLETVIEASKSCLRSANTIIDSVAQLAWINDKVPVPKSSPLPLMPILSQAVEEIRPLARENALDIRLVPTSAHCLVDPDFLERIVRNLLHNAVQYTDGGHILIGVRPKPSKGSVELWICDTGPGIPDNELESIFQAYHQSPQHKRLSAGNIGLGLTIVHDLADALDGSVAVSSTEGKGSTFRVALPCARTKPNSANPTIQLLGRKILVIDDQLDFIDVVATILETEGAEIFPISDVAQLPSPVQLSKFDAFVLDFDLGGGLTAKEVFEANSELAPSKTVIVTLSPETAAAKLKSLKIAKVLPKPVGRQILLRTLSAIFTSSHTDE